jgi:hypothetical protein
MASVAPPGHRRVESNCANHTPLRVWRRETIACLSWLAARALKVASLNSLSGFDHQNGPTDGQDRKYYFSTMIYYFAEILGPFDLDY